MPTTTPLTDAINALTSYSNTVTGHTDQTLSEAVATLAAGYGGSVLPAGYTQMLFLDSSGSEYIDTGLNTKAADSYTVYFERLTGAGTSINVFGNNVSNCASFIQLAAGGDKIYWQFGNIAYHTYTIQGAARLYASMFCYRFNAESFDEYNITTQTFEPVDTQTGASVTENSNVHNILFGRSTGANTRQLSTVRFYRFIAERNGNKVRDMYPAMRDSDKVLGMYDTVNDVFYTNAGSGTFSAGLFI